MIRRLRGTLVEKGPTNVVVDAGGVGYGLAVSLGTGYRLPDPGDEVELFVHTHVYETGIDLFGFADAAERAVFTKLIAVSGIGPKLAINILSGMEAPDLLTAVAEGDLARLVRIPGVGKKTAERMVVELKDKFRALAAYQPSPAAPSAAAGSLLEDVTSALTNLGYKAAKVAKVVPGLAERAEEGATIQELLREALRLLQR